MKLDKPGQPGKKQKNGKGNVNLRWVLTIFGVTVCISALFSLISTEILDSAGLVLAFFVLFFIIFLGIIFDIVGVAVTAADAKPFHSMAAHKVPGAQEALKMLKNAEKVSSFCNDVVGDICGVISGSASAVLVAQLVFQLGAGKRWMNLAMAALVAGLTVGGKAIGKSLAIRSSTKIVHLAALVVYYVKTAGQAIKRFFGKKQNEA